MNTVYQEEPDLSTSEFIDLLKRSTLAERRPVDEPDCITKMLENADIIITARFEGRLIGVSRSISDFAYCTYLSDLAVDVDFQKQGIGKQLISETQKVSGSKTKIILLAAPDARAYYPHVGFQPHDSCWTIDSLIDE